MAAQLRLIDVRMPWMTEHRVASGLRAMRPDVRVRYVTGSEDAVEARPERRESALSKPSGIGALLETVQRVLAG